MSTPAHDRLTGPRRQAAAVAVLACAMAIAGLAPPAHAQVVINEVICDIQTTSPVLSLPLIELWNRGQYPVDVTGWQMGMWAGDTGALQTWTIPPQYPAAGDRIIYGRCFLLVGKALSASNCNFTEFYLGTAVRGLRLGTTWPWTTTADLGVWFKDAQGNLVDYVYLRRGTTVAPSTPPHLPAGGTWITGNVGATATGFGHLQRRTNANTHSFADWMQTPSSATTSWGAINTTAPATQTSLGACVCLYQVNQPASSLDVNGSQWPSTVSGTPVFGASPCSADPFVVHLQSTRIGSPFDIGLTFGPKVTTITGGFITPGGQFVNLNLADSSFVFLNGGGGMTPFLGNVSIPLAIQFQTMISVQMVVADPAAVDGFTLSAPAEVDTIMTGLASAPISGHGAVSEQLLVGQGLAYGWCDTTVAFFGTTYSSVGLTSSGRVPLFLPAIGAPASAFEVTPTLGSAMNGAPFVGVWCDLTVTSSVTNTPGSAWLHAVSHGIVRADFQQVGYTVAPSVTCTFGVQFDQSTGIVQIDGLGGIQPLPSVNQFIGISAGGLNSGGYGANNFGPATFSPGYHAGPQAHAMIYALGPAGTLTPGISTIQFIPNGLGDYDYLCF